MDGSEYTSLAAALAAVPDPRHARGQRYPWWLLLTLHAAALLSGHTHGRAICQWVQEQADVLRAALGWHAPCWPSASTLRRALRDVAIEALEAQLAQVQLPLAGTDPERPWIGHAIDGKVVRGAGRHGQALHLLSLVRHDGVVLAQHQVGTKMNEIVAAPHLLAGRDLSGTLTTMDALLTQRDLAAQIIAQDGHYLMVVKDNQPTVHAAIATLFATPPWLPHERAHEYARSTTVDKGHGRLETRTLEASPSLNGWLDWPAVGQVLRRTCRRVILRTGEVEEAISYAVTSVPFQSGSLPWLAAAWRGHWSIENKVHYVRDVTWGEDRGQAHTGSTARALAALRNACTNLVRAHGWSLIPDAIRHIAISPLRALTLLGVTSARL